MLRVRKDELRLGMYIHSLDGSWIDHPFWKTKFLLSEGKDLRDLQDSTVETIWVDPAKSVAEAIAHLMAPAAPMMEVAAPEPVPVSAIVQPIPRRPAGRPVFGRAKPRRPNDYVAAQAFIEDVTQPIATLLDEVRLGNAEAVAAAVPLVTDIAQYTETDPHGLITMTRVRSKNEYTYTHSLAVSAMMINLAKQLSLPADYVREAGLAGLMHDAGHVFVPDEILNHPAEHDEAQREIMRAHAGQGADALRAGGKVSRGVIDTCAQHHEKYDGTGYPLGLKGDEISLFARMASLCDIYDALTSVRPYRPAWNPADAVAELYRMGGHFDESVLTAFIRSIGIYPVGSLVRLESRRLGCIAAQKGELTKPVVRAFYCISAGAPLPIEEIDLARNPTADRIIARENPERWGFKHWESQAIELLRVKQGQRLAA